MNDDKLVVCPMFGDPCRHCSIVRVIRPYTKIRKNDKGYFDPAGLGKTVEVIGEFCNNDGTKLVQDMHYCPARWGLYRGVVPEKPKPKKGRPKKSLGNTEQKKKVGRPKKNVTRKIREKAVRTVRKKTQRAAAVSVARTKGRERTRRTGK